MIERKGNKGDNAKTMMKLPTVPQESGSNTPGFIAKLVEAKRKGTQKHPINDPKICYQKMVLKVLKKFLKII